MMQQSLMTVYSAGCFMIPCIVWQFTNRRKLKKGTAGCWHVVWSYIFILYCFLAAQAVAGIGTLWDLLAYGKIMGPVNLIPFQSEGAMTYILNIIMFMPLGFLLPLNWKRYRAVKKVLVLGILFSLMIEVFQLFCLRATDIDDLFMNTIGAVAGYLVWWMFHKVFPRTSSNAVTMGTHEPIVYMVLGIGGTFFLYNWRLFY